MRLNVNVAVGCLLASGLLSADPPTCVAGTLADYIALGAQGCTLNGDVFANFSYVASASGGAATITADQITVTPLVVVPATARFNFSAPWSVDQDQTQDSVVRYTVVPPPGGTAPSQLQLTLGSAQVRGIIGSVMVDESTNVGELSVSVRCTEVCQTKSKDSLNFDPVSVVLVRDHVSLSGGTDGASLSEFGVALDRCPLCV
jgi:hypothetical protein